MPTANFGEDIKIGSGNFFVSLKEKDESIRVRLLAAPYYDGMHFLKKADGTWDRIACTRVNEGNPCGYCEQYFDIIGAVKDKDDKVKMDEARKAADPYRATITFYYPVINRETQQFQIFKTRKSVRDDIEAKSRKGIKVLERDLVITRTERPGAGYYSVDVMDSSETAPLTALENEAVAKYKEKSLEEYIYGTTRDENSAVAVDEANQTPESQAKTEDIKAGIREKLHPSTGTTTVDEVNIEDIPF
ncbi:MAG: hypothetical protein IFNCLDLE_02626 [Ignavibacteriaceae bacterium]|nr:hypothetical protein [Ignavibacteriaceae bacterium]